MGQKLAPELTYAAHGGAFPIRLKGLDFTNPIGVIVVSGLARALADGLALRRIAVALGFPQS